MGQDFVALKAKARRKRVLLGKEIGLWPQTWICGIGLKNCSSDEDKEFWRQKMVEGLNVQV